MQVTCSNNHSLECKHSWLELMHSRWRAPDLAATETRSCAQQYKDTTVEEDEIQFHSIHYSGIVVPSANWEQRNIPWSERWLDFTWTIFLSDMPATRRFCLSSSGLNLTQYGTFLLVKREMHWPAGEREEKVGALTRGKPEESNTAALL